MQVIGIFALVASLIFVGLQMKLTQKIALADQYQLRAQATMDYFAARMEGNYANAEYMESIGLDVTPQQLINRPNAAHIVWTILDNNHFQYQQGFVTEESWQALATYVRNSYARCDERFIYESRRSAFRESFVEFVESQDDPCVEDQ